MIKITAELISARTGKIKELFKIKIYNDTTGTENQGNYQVELKYPNKEIKTIQVYSFPRKRLWAEDLLLRALVKLVGHRNGL
jgi:hypothetical protein